MSNSFLILLVAGILLSAAAVAQVNVKHDFNHTCGNCHGKDGGGKTTYGVENNVPDLRSRHTQSMTDAQLTDSIARGTNHRTYPHSFVLRHVLAEDEVREIVQEVRRLAK